MGILIELWDQADTCPLFLASKKSPAAKFQVYSYIRLNTKSDNSGQVHQLVETIGNIGKLIFLDNFRRNRKRIKGGVQLLKV